METLILFVISAVVFYRLWSILGARTGHERKHDWNTSNQPDPEIIVVEATLSGLDTETASSNLEISEKIERLKDVIPSFNLDGFIKGAEKAFTKIVQSFYDGTIQPIKNLLSPAVEEVFTRNIELRQLSNQTIEFQIKDIKLKIIDVFSDTDLARITVEFTTEQILVTINSNGQSYDNPARLSRTIKDCWVFERLLVSSSKVWILTKTLHT